MKTIENHRLHWLGIFIGVVGLASLLVVSYAFLSKFIDNRNYRATVGAALIEAKAYSENICIKSNDIKNAKVDLYGNPLMQKTNSNESIMIGCDGKVLLIKGLRSADCERLNPSYARCFLDYSKTSGV